MRFYTRKELVRIIGCDERFVVSLEREEILSQDAPADVSAEFSERMLERARVARTLVEDLDVNVEGAAIIVRLREEISDLHRHLARLIRS